MQTGVTLIKEHSMNYSCMFVAKNMYHALRSFWQEQRC